MSLLNQLFAAGNTPWAQEQMARMVGPTAGPVAGPMPVAAPMAGPAQMMPLGGPPVAPAPATRPETEPTAKVNPAPSRPDFNSGIGGQEVFGAILQGLGGVAAPLGRLVSQGAAQGKQADVKNQTYDWLISKGVEPQEAAAAVTNPEIGKIVLGRVLGTAKTTEAATKGLPQGYTWNDPADPSKGASRVPGVAEKPDPVETAFKKEEIKADNKYLTELRKEGNIGRDTLDKILQLRKAREAVSYEGGAFPETRTWLGKNLPDGVGPFGIPFIPSQEEAGAAEQVKSLATDIQLQFTQKTKGAISNREMDLFGQATPGLTMSDEGAQRVMNGFEAGARRMREKPKFFEAYRRQNGSLDGADDAWDRFVDERPVLVDDGKGGFQIDDNNVASWRDYVAPPSANAGQPAAQGQASLEAEKTVNGKRYVKVNGQWFEQ